MRKFIVSTFKGTTTVIEVDVRDVTWTEDPSLAWQLKNGEGCYVIQSPASLAGERYYSWAFFETDESALQSAIFGVEQEAERSARKAHTDVDQSLLSSKLSSIKTTYLKSDI